MIVILKPNPDPVQAENLIEWIKGYGLDIHTSQGATHTILGLVGDTTVIDIDLIRAMDIVEDVRRVQEPYKNANRKIPPPGHRDGAWETASRLGGGHFASRSPGPAPWRREEQICLVARAGEGRRRRACSGAAPSSPAPPPTPSRAWRTRASDCCSRPSAHTGLPIVTEIMELEPAGSASTDVDVIQVGARNMQNF